jgi:RecB family exonuclease
MEYLINLETAKARVLLEMKYHKTTFGSLASNPAGLLRRTIDDYYGLRRRIKPEDRKDFDSWLGDTYEDFGKQIYADVLERLVVDFRYHILSSKR